MLDEDSGFIKHAQKLVTVRKKISKLIAARCTPCVVFILYHF